MDCEEIDCGGIGWIISAGDWRLVGVASKLRPARLYILGDEDDGETEFIEVVMMGCVEAPTLEGGLV